MIILMLTLKRMKKVHHRICMYLNNRRRMKKTAKPVG